MTILSGRRYRCPGVTKSQAGFHQLECFHRCYVILFAYINNFIYAENIISL